MRKHILAALFCLILTVTAAAESEPVTGNGSCGEGLTWTLDASGTLTISGSGAMSDYDDMYAPWFDNGDSIKTVKVESGVTSIGANAFSGCSALTGVTLPDGVTSIGAYAFGGCAALTGVTIPAGVTSIGDYAFYGCGGLTDVLIPGSVTSIGMYAFSNCIGLTGVTISNGVASIGEGAFYGCSGLRGVSIPNGVTSIGPSAFEECNGLTYLAIPASVVSVGNGAFSGCGGLTDVYYTGSRAQWKAIGIDINDNDPLTSAAIHYNSLKDSIHAEISWSDASRVILLDPNGLLSRCKTIFLAVYDTNGKLTRIRGGQLGQGTVRFQPEAEKGGVLFFLDDQFRPLCQNVIL